MNNQLGIVTRFYGLTEADVKRLDVWVKAALTVISPDNVFVAIRVEEDLSGSQNFMNNEYPKVNAFPVTPWGKVVQAPNALLSKCAERGIDQVLFTSTEYPVTQSLVSLLQNHLDTETLVVGARLTPHDFKATLDRTVLVEEASGLQIPWNTCALWSIERLVHTGFVLAADSLHDPDNAGMEEMGTIAAQQILWPGSASAKLVSLPEGALVTNTQGWSVKRQERHLGVLRSKNFRSAEQMKRLRLKQPTVSHIG